MSATVVSSPAVARPRSAVVDSWRFVAIGLMVADHVCLVVSQLRPEWALPVLFRSTVGRLAMPLFFLVGGMLVRRLSWRHAGLYGLGLVLPVVVPWIDSPNVLGWYAGGAVVLVLWRWADLPVFVLALPALLMAANGYDVEVGTGFQPLALLGLMALGAVVGRDRLPALTLPAWMRVVARFPVSVYVGHLLVLHCVLVVVSGRAWT